MRLLTIGLLTALAFALVACGAQPVTYDTPLIIGKKVEPPRTQVASLWNPSSADAQIIPSYPSSGGGGASSTIYPALVPTAGQVAIGNAGGTAYAPVTLSGCVVSSAGVVSGCTAAAGGTGTTYGAPACTSLGTIANAGTISPNYANTNCNVWSTAGASSNFTLANPTNIPTNGLVYLTETQTSGGFPNIGTFGTAYLGYNSADNKMETLQTDQAFNAAMCYTNNSIGSCTLVFYSDGSNLTLIPVGSNKPAVSAIKVNGTVTAGGGSFSGAITTTTSNVTSTSGAITTGTGNMGTTGGGAIQTSGGTLPTVAGGCGAGNTNAGSTNNRGSVTTGTTETTCQVVFSASGTFANAPFCVCEDANGSAAPLGCSVSATTTAHFSMTFAAATAKVFNWLCF